MVRPRLLLLSALFCSLPSLAFPATLEQVLDRLDAVASLYRDNALRFTCREAIVETGAGPRRRIELAYVYRYDEAGDRFEDFRMREGESRETRKGAEKAARPVELFEYGFQAYLERAYSWIFLFEAARRPGFRFELRETVDEPFDVPAFEIRFEPVAPFIEDYNEWSGSAWFDARTFQPLRVDAVRRLDAVERETFLRLRERAESGEEIDPAWSGPICEVTTEFGVVKNGMRFPSETLNRIVRLEVWSKRNGAGYRKRQVFRVRQTYDDYRFFGVRTAAEIQRRVVDSGGD